MSSQRLFQPSTAHNDTVSVARLASEGRAAAFPAGGEFVGRASEMRTIRVHLADPAHRVLTIVGPGGIGKTRLALEIGREIARRQRKTFYQVALQPVTSPNRVADVVAQTLGIDLSRGSEPRQQIIDTLRTQRAVLLLDNFEQVRDAAPLVQEIAAQCSQVRQIITSRERLALDAEKVVEIGGLEYPARGDEARAFSLGAVQLFAQTAVRAWPDFNLYSEIDAVARICALLEGYPLAIVLAASWVRVLSCADILAQIQGNLQTLDSVTEVLNGRHRSMAATLQGSWERLSARDREIFCGISVFRGGFDLAAVARVTGATPQNIATLIEQSWLRRDEVVGRYQVHELLRQYGGEQQRDDHHGETHHREAHHGETHHREAHVGKNYAGEDWWRAQSEIVRQAALRHSQHYLDLLGALDGEMTGREQKRALQRIDADLSNFQSALLWAARAPQTVTVKTTLYGLWFYYDRGSRFHECEEFFAQLIAELYPRDQETNVRLLLAPALAIYASMCSNLGRPHDALHHFRAALEMLREMDAPRVTAFALYRMGAALRFVHGGLSEAAECFQRSLDLYRQADDTSGVVTALGWLGDVQLGLGDVDAARKSTLSALAIARERGVAWEIANTATFRGAVLKRAGEWADARQLFREACELYGELGILWGEIKSAREVGFLSIELGDFPEARASLRHALLLARDHRLHEHACHVLVQASRLLNVLDDAVALLATVERGLTVLQQETTPALDALAHVQPRMAAPRFRCAMERGQTLGLERAIAMALDALAEPAPSAESAIAAQSCLIEPLTLREVEILRLIAEGCSNRAIAERLALTTGTVKWYVSAIFGKLGAASRTQVIARGRAAGILA